MGKGPKTKKSLSKRFKLTGTGRLMVKKKAGRSHLMGSKSSKRKRQLRLQPMLGATATKSIKNMMHI